MMYPVLMGRQRSAQDGFIQPLCQIDAQHPTRSITARPSLPDIPRPRLSRASEDQRMSLNHHPSPFRSVRARTRHLPQSSKGCHDQTSPSNQSRGRHQYIYIRIGHCMLHRYPTYERLVHERIQGESDGLWSAIFTGSHGTR